MPNRTLRERLRYSKKVAALTDFEFRLYILLFTLASDYGRYDADPQFVTSNALPYSKITASKVAAALQSMRDKGLITLYEVDGNQFLEIAQWDARVRSHEKYPAPAQAVAEKRQSDDSHETGVRARGTRYEGRGTRYEVRGEDIAQSQQPDSTPPPAVVERIPLSGIKDPFHDVTAEDIKKLQHDFPGVEIKREIVKLRRWNEDNPKRRKTATGIKRHISSWMDKAQNKDGGRNDPAIRRRPQVKSMYDKGTP